VVGRRVSGDVAALSTVFLAKGALELGRGFAIHAASDCGGPYRAYEVVAHGAIVAPQRALSHRCNG
jgi:hypothetical protein